VLSRKRGEQGRLQPKTFFASEAPKPKEDLEAAGPMTFRGKAARGSASGSAGKEAVATGRRPTASPGGATGGATGGAPVGHTGSSDEDSGDGGGPRIRLVGGKGAGAKGAGAKGAGADAAAGRRREASPPQQRKAPAGAKRARLSFDED